MECFVIVRTSAKAYQRLPRQLPVLRTMDDLMELQDKIECDISISMPNKYGQRQVRLFDPK